MCDDWETLTVNERRYRYSKVYCGYVRSLDNCDLFNYFGYVGRLQVVCEHISDVEERPVPVRTVRNRLSRGVDFRDAVSGPFYKMDRFDKSGRRCKRFFNVEGKEMSMNELSSAYKVKSNTILQRLKRGWSIEEAVGICPRNKN